MVVGVSGKYCAGKNLAAEILARNGFRVVDVDALGHRALEREKAGILARFGGGVLAEDGGVDRRALGRLVFGSARELAALEAIVHPGMVEEVKRELPSEGDAAINAALLFKMGLHPLCGRIIWMKAPLIQRIRRGILRDKLTFAQVLRLVWAQRKLSPQPFLKTVDIRIIRNSGEVERVEAEVLEAVKD